LLRWGGGVMDAWLVLALAALALALLGVALRGRGGGVRFGAC